MVTWACSPQPAGIEGKVEFKLKKAKKPTTSTTKSEKKSRKKKGNRTETVTQNKTEKQTTAQTSGHPTFTPADGSKVEARVKLTGLEPGRTEVVHLVWLKPGGKEMFRKTEEFICEKDTKSLKSRLNIALEKNRIPGKYALKVYRHRRLLTMEVFELTEPEEAESSG